MAHDPAQIIAELERQFTGDAEHDLDVLRQYCATLPHTDDNVDIITAIGHYVLAHFPDAAETANARLFEKSYDEFESLVQKAQDALRARRFEEAATLYGRLIDDVRPTNTPDAYYFAFAHPFEEMIVRATHLYDDRRIERIPQLPAMLYFQQGSALFELARYDEARDAFRNVLALNPVSAPAFFELIQIAKARRDFDEVRALLRKAYPYLFTRHFLARYYREHANLATYDNRHALAVALLHLSMDYEQSPQAVAMLENLRDACGADVTLPPVARIKELLTAADIPVGPNPATYELAILIGNQMKPIHPDVAKMAYAIAYDLTHYQPLLQELEGG